MATTKAEDELVEQIALGEGFQLLIVIVEAVELHGFAQRLANASAAARARPVDHLVLDPYLGLPPSSQLSEEHLDRWVLQPLLRSPLIRAAVDPLIVVDLSSFRVLGEDQEVWREFASFVNRQRNALMRAFAGSLVLVMAEGFATELAGVAPDLWSVRSGVVRLGEVAEGDGRIDEPKGLFAEQVRLRREAWRRGAREDQLAAIIDDLFPGAGLPNMATPRALQMSAALESPIPSGLEQRLMALSDREFEGLRHKIGVPRGLVRSARGDRRARSGLLIGWARAAGRADALRAWFEPSAPEELAAEGRRYALLLEGSGDSGTKHDLYMMKSLFEQRGFMLDVLTQPPLPSLWAALEDLRRRVEPEDQVVVYFTGHGVEHHGMGYARQLSSDQALLLDSDLVERIEAITLLCANVTLIVDSSDFGRGLRLRTPLVILSPGFGTAKSNSQGGVFTQALVRALGDHRVTTWGHVIDESTTVLGGTPRLIGPRGRVVFGTETHDTSRTFLVAYEEVRTLLTSAGRLHGLDEGDHVALFDVGHTLLGHARLTSLSPTWSVAEVSDSLPPETVRAAHSCVLHRRATPTRVGFDGEPRTPPAEALKHAIEASPWLDLDGHPELLVDPEALEFTGPGLPTLHCAGAETLEAVARTRAFEAYVETLTPPPSYDCQASFIGDALQVSLEHELDSRELLAHLFLVGPDAKLSLLVGNHRGGLAQAFAFDTRSPVAHARLWLLSTSATFSFFGGAHIPARDEAYAKRVELSRSQRS